MKYFSLLLLFLFSLSIQAQSIDEEIGFIYTKAKYMIETNRTEDAVKELNKIIKKDPSFQDALLLRAEAKYKLGAYTGVKNDLAQYIGLKGITPRVAGLYGLTDFQGGNKEAALNSLTIALQSIKDNKKLYETRAQIYEANDQLLKACADYKSARELGSNIGTRKSKSLCGEEEVKEKRRTHLDSNSASTKKQESEEAKESTEVVIVDPSQMGEKDIEEVEEKDEKVEASVEENTKVEKEEERDEEEVVEEIQEDRINEIEVDEDLTLIITGGGLGSREIVDKPNILILSDDTGDVSINVCVSRAGRVTYAEFDNINSTIKKQSLVSLALRKSRDFWFEKNGTKEQCGKIVFKIQGI